MNLRLHWLLALLILHHMWLSTARMRLQLAWYYLSCLRSSFPFPFPRFRVFQLPVAMIIWLRLPSSYIYKWSSTRYREYHNNHMITSSHIQIVNLKVEVLYCCFSCSGTSAWSWFSSTHARHRARAHFPAVRRRPHIYQAVIVPADKCGSIFNTGRLLWSLVHPAVLLRLFWA